MMSPNMTYGVFTTPFEGHWWVTGASCARIFEDQVFYSQLFLARAANCLQQDPCVLPTEYKQRSMRFVS